MRAYSANLPKQYQTIMSLSRDIAFGHFAANEPGDTTSFYQAEGQVLELWDQLTELKLEQALLEAQSMLEQSGGCIQIRTLGSI